MHCFAGGNTLSNPRAENDQHLMSMGDVALVLGTAIEYDIAELVDPQINVVAKIDKARLPSFTQSR